MKARAGLSNLPAGLLPSFDFAPNLRASHGALRGGAPSDLTRQNVSGSGQIFFLAY